MSKSIINNLFLKPLSNIWESAYRIRRSIYEYGIIKKDYFRVPIISVGNLTFGGTGKTPLIIWFVKKFEEMSLVPVVLTRGYKGKLENTSGILRGDQNFRLNPQEYGDEPLLITQHLKSGSVIVGKRRAENLKRHFHEVEPDVVLLDDGFQHIQLYRSFNVVLFDALLPLESYKTAPLGYLREGLTSLKDADVILISRADQVDSEKIDALLDLLRPHHRRDVTVGKIKYVPSGFYNCYYHKVLEVSEIKGKNVVALTAIASPESFYKMLEQYGATIMDKFEFPDHHFFTQEEIDQISISALKNDALIVSSEKDMVKIKRITQDEQFLFMDIQVQFMSGEKELLSGISKIINLDYH
jgi:tetraacyldisaccharide 4'-kinase